MGGGRGIGGREGDRRSKTAGCKGNRGKIISKHFVIEKKAKGRKLRKGVEPKM